jgi:hypothetical protein
MGALALVAALTVALGGPALAAGTPVSVSATVGQSITLTGLSTSVAFPTTVPGQTASITGAESYSVGTNDQAGYTLTETAGTNAFMDGGSATIPTSPNWVVAVTGPGVTISFSPTTTPKTVTAPAAATSGDAYTENWSLAIPAGQPAGAYTDSLVYLAIGN